MHAISMCTHEILIIKSSLQHGLIDTAQRSRAVTHPSRDAVVVAVMHEVTEQQLGQVLDQSMPRVA